MVGPPPPELRSLTGPIHGTLVVPQPPTKRGGVLLIGGSRGEEPRFLAEAFANSGFVALSLAYFGRPGLPSQLKGIPLEYFRDALIQLQSALADRSDRITVVGISRGSEAALLTGIYFDQFIRAIVASVPGNVVLCSWPPGFPAWTLSGDPLPFVSRFGPACATPEAVIGVEQIPTPIIMISGGADRVWPSSTMARAIAERRRTRPISRLDRLLEYPKANHSVGYLTPTLPQGLLQFRESDEDVRAREDAWPKILDFLTALHQT